MKESDVKSRLCPHKSEDKAILLLAAILHEPEETKTAALNIIRNEGIDHCNGSDCVMWESQYKEEFDEVEVDYYEDWHDYRHPDDPDKQHWKYRKIVEYRTGDKVLILFVRYTPTEYGNCGLKSKEQGCNYG